MSANAINSCVYDEDIGTYYEECIIHVINTMLGRPLVTEDNFEGTHIKSRSTDDPERRYRFYIELPDGSEHELPVLYGSKYGNSMGGFVNSLTADGRLPASLTPVHRELLKGLMRLASMGSKRPISNIVTRASNYVPGYTWPGAAATRAAGIQSSINNATAYATAYAAAAKKKGGKRTRRKLSRRNRKSSYRRK